MEEEALRRYPRSLSDGLLLRPLRADDESALAAFFARIPVDERKLFKEDVTRVEVIRGWIRNLNYENILPLLVFQDDEVVADATLHRDRAGWSRHVAKLRLTLDPDVRGRGLALALVQEFIALAKPLRIAILHAEILPAQRDAIELFEGLDFQRVAVLPQQAIDFAGRVHDVLVYALTVTPPDRFAPEASLAEEDADVGGS